MFRNNVQDSSCIAHRSSNLTSFLETCGASCSTEASGSAAPAIAWVMGQSSWGASIRIFCSNLVSRWTVSQARAIHGRGRDCCIFSGEWLASHAGSCYNDIILCYLARGWQHTISLYQVRDFKIMWFQLWFRDFNSDFMISTNKDFRLQWFQISTLTVLRTAWFLFTVMISRQISDFNI